MMDIKQHSKNQSYRTDEDKAFIAHLKGADVDNDSITFTILENGNLGIVSITEMSSGTFNYSPYLNEYGTDSFRYQTSDGLAVSTPAVVSITINPINDPPLANAGADQIVLEGQNVVLNGAESFDVDTDDLIFSWEQTSGIPVILLESKKVQSSFMAPSVTPEGDELIFSLLVSDTEQLISEDSVLITVNNVFTKGDLNDNGEIDLEDAVLALQLIAGMDDNKAYRKATVDSKQLHLIDAVYILQYIIFR